MRTLLRNFISIFRRYTIPMALNILGLAAAFAVFLIIMMQIDFDRNFDSCHVNADRIYRLELNHGSEGWSNTNCRPFGELFIASSPHILAGAIADEIDLGGGSTDFTFDSPSGKISIHEQVINVTPGYADVFAFDMAEGSDKALSEPDNILIPLSMARKFFGDKNATGMTLRSPGGNFTVGGVYRDFPRNSSVANRVYVPFPKDMNVDNWNKWNYSCYIRIDDSSDANLLLSDFRKTIKVTALVKDLPLKEEDIQFRLSPLAELHYLANVRYDAVPKSDRRTGAILLVIAIAILTIGGINFSNFSMALAPKRIRSVLKKFSGPRLCPYAPCWFWNPCARRSWLSSLLSEL